MKFLVPEQAFREVDLITWLSSLMGAMCYKVASVVAIVVILRLMGVEI